MYANNPFVAGARALFARRFATRDAFRDSITNDFCVQLTYILTANKDKVYSYKRDNKWSPQICGRRPSWAIGW